MTQFERSILEKFRKEFPIEIKDGFWKSQSQRNRMEDFIIDSLREQRESLKIGDLRQWFNKRQWKDVVTNEEIKTILGLKVADSRPLECGCHCHNDEDGKLAARGIQCKCIKNCEHCQPEMKGDEA